jgi:signal peptidase I
MGAQGKPTASILKKFWHFLWYEDSVASWVVSILLAFLTIKFILYPLLGLVFGTQFPVVAVVSNSMEHNNGFDAWWTGQEDRYLQFNITRNDFNNYPMRGGFNKGDIIILVGMRPERIQLGDIIVFWGGKEYPIIHRVVAIGAESDGTPYFQTKGDHNTGQIVTPPQLDERHVPADVVVGRAVLRVPYLGWVKIGFVSLLQLIGLQVS